MPRPPPLISREEALGLGELTGRAEIEGLIERDWRAAGSTRSASGSRHHGRARDQGLPTRRLPKGVRVTAITSLDLVRRDRRDAPDLLWMTDITEHSTREGKVYC